MIHFASKLRERDVAIGGWGESRINEPGLGQGHECVMHVAAGLGALSRGTKKKEKK